MKMAVSSRDTFITCVLIFILININNRVLISHNTRLKFYTYSHRHIYINIKLISGVFVRNPTQTRVCISEVKGVRRLSSSPVSLFNISI